MGDDGWWSYILELSESIDVFFRLFLVVKHHRFVNWQGLQFTRNLFNIFSVVPPSYFGTLEPKKRCQSQQHHQSNKKTTSRGWFHRPDCRRRLDVSAEDQTQDGQTAIPFVDLDQNSALRWRGCAPQWLQLWSHCALARCVDLRAWLPKWLIEIDVRKIEQ